MALTLLGLLACQVIHYRLVSSSLSGLHERETTGPEHARLPVLQVCAGRGLTSSQGSGSVEGMYGEKHDLRVKKRQCYDLPALWLQARGFYFTEPQFLHL